MRRLCFALSLLLALTTAAQARTEFGKLQGAAFRIDVPDNWNHGLVVYYHGYDAEDHGMDYDEKAPLDPRLAVFTKAGYAVIQSGYSQEGWALEQAIPETEALRRYFIDKYGAPTETYVSGASMGGMLTVMTMEQSPENYVAGLDLCGAAENTPALFTRAFDVSVLFDYYFPGVLPNPAKVPADFEISEKLEKKIGELLQSKPQAAASLRRFSGLRDNKDLTGNLVFLGWVLKDIERRARGNPFDNRNTIYTGTTDDNAVNDGVKRYAADRGALAYLERYYTPTGHLTKPVLALHTTYDPLVAPSVPSNYSMLARTAGAGDEFVVQYVEHDGHCNFTPGEVGRAFAELVEWKEKGVRPAPGGLH
ncbi:MAG TPA: alpha/beta hydrolase [Candidatus Sulfotelmatobacter sp.]